MATMQLTLEHARGHVFRTKTPSGHEVVFDSSATPGGDGPTPVEMLLASCAACSLVDVADILAKKRVEFRGLRAVITGERRDTFPRAFTSIRVAYEVSGNVPEKDLHRACELSVEKYCSVMATVREAPPLTWTAVVRS